MQAGPATECCKQEFRRGGPAPRRIGATGTARGRDSRGCSEIRSAGGGLFDGIAGFCQRTGGFGGALPRLARKVLALIPSGLIVPSAGFTAACSGLGRGVLLSGFEETGARVEAGVGSPETRPSAPGFVECSKSGVPTRLTLYRILSPVFVPFGAVTGW